MKDVEVGTYRVRYEAENWYFKWVIERCYRYYIGLNLWEYVDACRTEGGAISVARSYAALDKKEQDSRKERYRQRIKSEENATMISPRK